MTSNWFECKVRYDKPNEAGIPAKVKEPYLVDAMSFTEAERRLIEEMRPRISGEFVVEDIKRTRLAEVCENIDANADRWYRAKLAFITLDEESGKEKRSNNLMMVQAVDFAGALTAVNNAMKGTLQDWVIVSITETAILDVFRYRKMDAVAATTPEEA